MSNFVKVLQGLTVNFLNMNKLAYFLGIWIWILTFACVDNKKSDVSEDVLKENNLEIEHLPANNDCDFFPNPKKQDPIDFLYALKWRDCGYQKTIFIHPDSIPDNWIKEKHLPILISELDNEEIAFPIASMYASVTLGNHGFNTIGLHAYHLIKHYQGQTYPPYSTFEKDKNDTLKLSREQRSEIMDWWATNP
jgi:hypothetical protein